MRSNAGSRWTSEEIEFGKNSRTKLALKEAWALSFCTLAAISATFLSGIHFPEQNNIWYLPIVLDFAHSVEGPHDAYNKTFAHFFSYFWILVRMISTEENVQMVFISLQLLGNSLLAMLIYAFMRTITKNIMRSAMIAAGFSFCYGLWGATRLGYSEVFVTYATHTQFAIIVCLLGILLLVHLRILWASTFFGLAANINLFMAVWTTAAGGLFTVALERRLPTWRQIKFAAIMILVSTPTLVWAFSGATIHRPAIPTSFIHIMTGHIYALVYPQALIQTLALGLVAALAMIANHKDNLPACRLGIATLCCVAALTIGTAMPYVTDAQLLLLLLPLRFTSVVVLLAAISAGVLVVLRMNERTDQSLGAFLAAGGFLLKSPIVSIFGFSLLLPATSSGYRSLRIMIPIIGVLAVWLWAPITEASPKSALAFILLSAILVAASWRRQGGISEDDGLLMATGGLLGSMAAAPFSAYVRAAALFAAFAIFTLMLPASQIFRKAALACTVLGMILILTR